MCLKKEIATCSISSSKPQASAFLSKESPHIYSTQPFPGLYHLASSTACPQQQHVIHVKHMAHSGIPSEVPGCT